MLIDDKSAARKPFAARPTQNEAVRTTESVATASSISIGKRLRSPQTLISFVAAFAIIFFVFRNLDLNLSDIWTTMKTGNPLLIALGFAAYYVSFPLRAIRWRALLNSAGINEEQGYPVPGTRGLTEIFILSWFANCVVPAKLGDAYRGYLLKKHAKPSFAHTIGTIFAERVIDVFALVSLMLLSILLVFHGTLPSSLRFPVAGGAGLVLVGVAGMGSLFWYGNAIGNRFPERVQPYFHRLQSGITTSFSRSSLPRTIGITALIWTLEGARLYFVATAFGVEINAPEAVFVALLASFLTVIPLTPAGLGVVESGTIIALKLLDIPATEAATIAIVDRGIAYWSVIVVGAIVYLVSKYR